MWRPMPFPRPRFGYGEVARLAAEVFLRLLRVQEVRIGYRRKGPDPRPAAYKTCNSSARAEDHSRFVVLEGISSKSCIVY
jgi:hypothetical protein